MLSWPDAPVRATGVALGDCKPSIEVERKAVTASANDLKDALAKDDMRTLRELLSDPVLGRLDGKKQTIHWPKVKARFQDVFGPRVREAVSAGRLARSGRNWMLGNSVVFLSLVQHGAGCGIEVSRVFEQPSPDAAGGSPSNPALQRPRLVPRR
jgi:hypothetical protein